jgi:hypothetical protein
MKQNRKTLPTLLLIIVLAASAFIVAQSVSALSPIRQGVSEFTLNYVDHSYDVPPQPISTKDPYTGEVTTSTIPGYHVENKTIEVTIKNPPGVTYYNFRWKAHYQDQVDQWQYNPAYPNSQGDTYVIQSVVSVPFRASTSTYSTFTLFFIPSSVTPGGKIDIQVQALYGEYENVSTGMIFPPDYITYNFKFRGEVSDWSAMEIFTKPTLPPSPTVTPTATASPSPTVPEFPALVILPIIVVVSLVATVLLRKNLGFNKRSDIRGH